MGGWLTPRSRRFTPGMTRHLLYKRLGGPQGRFERMRIISHPPEFDRRIIQPVASRNTVYATGSIHITFYYYLWQVVQSMDVFSGMLFVQDLQICHLLSVIWKFVFHSGTYRERFTYLAGGDSYSELFLWARKKEYRNMRFL